MNINLHDQLVFDQKILLEAVTVSDREDWHGISVARKCDFIEAALKLTISRYMPCLLHVHFNFMDLHIFF